MTAASRDATVRAFLDQYWKDRQQQSVGPLCDYLESFPDEQEAVAAEYLALQR